ncbi:MAG: HlyD family secretion protein [Bacteroidota bacterium]
MNQKIGLLLVSFASLISLAGCSQSDPKFLGSGTLEAREVTVSAKSQGLLLTLLVEEGQTVKQNQPIGQIDDERLLAQKEELDARLKGLAVAAKRAEANKSQLKESHQSAQENFLRFKALYAAETAPKKSLDDSATAERTTRIALGAADLSFEEIAVQKKQLEASRKLLNLNIKDSSILAPLPGVVTKKYLEAGELANPGTPICRIADLSAPWVKVYLDEQSLGKIRLNGKVLVKAGKGAHEGTVSWISPKAEFTPKQVQTKEVNATLVYATKVLLKPSDDLRIGMPVEVALP